MKTILYRIVTLHFLLLILVSASAQTGSISGNITTSEGKAAAGVSVKLQNSKGGASTDQKGTYLIDRVKAGLYTVTVSAIGLSAQQKQVEVVEGETSAADFVLTETAAQLQEVIVSAGKFNRYNRTESEYVSKMPLSRMENPQVYSTLSKELLKDQLVFSVDDAMKNAPGIQKMWESTGRSGDGGSFYNTRGFIVQSSLRNGIAGIVSSTIDAANLEKVEVIKGPSATLFGSALTSYGGLMNRVTKKPYETAGGEISVAGGNYSFNRAAADINLPLDAAKKLLFRVNAAYNYDGSFQDRGYARSFAATPSLSFKPTEKLTINLDAELLYGNNIGKQIYFFYYPAAALGATRADQLNVDYEKSYMGNGLTQRTRSTNLFGQVNYTFSEKFSSSTNITSSNSFSNGFGPYFYFKPDNLVDSTAAAGSANYITRADQSTGESRYDIFEIQQNFNGDFKLGSLRNRIVFGLDYMRINSDQNFFGSEYDVVRVDAPPSDYNTFNSASLNTVYAAGPADFTYPIVNISSIYSAFASNVINLTDRLSILAALRIDHYDNQGGTEGAEITPYKQTAWSPKFGIVFQPVKNRISLFANYQNSFNNIGVYNSYDIGAPDSISRKIANLEQANQIEGGVKFELLEGRYSSTISYYDIQVKDILRSDPNPEAATRFARLQDGTQQSRGIELELTANPIKGLNIIAGFSYNDSEYIRADADVNGRRPSTASSPYLANVWMSYRLPASVVKGLGFGIGGNYASDNKIMNSISQGVFVLPSYTVLNASAFYDLKKMRISAKIDNLTNQKYWIGYTTMNPQKLRSFAGSIAYTF